MSDSHIVWTRQGGGWYTSDRGRICRERDGWYVYPRDSEGKFRLGPYRTLSDAKEVVQNGLPPRECQRRWRPL